MTKGGIRGIIRLTIKLNVNCLRKERRITWDPSYPAGPADPTRREILNLLKHGKKSAGEITQAFSITAAAISRHLSVLKEADLIRDQREGKYIFYELNTSVLEEIMIWFSELKGGKEDE